MESENETPRRRAEIVDEDHRRPMLHRVPRSAAAKPKQQEALNVADRLHSAAIHLLRRLRAELFVARDTVEWGVGIDYGYRGWVPVAQLNQTFVLRNATSLLVPDVETRLLFGIRRDFLADRVAAELAAVQEIERGYTTALGRATLAVSDHLRLRLGYLMIAGTRRSLIGQYHDNDEAFVQLRYSY